MRVALSSFAVLLLISAVIVNNPAFAQSSKVPVVVLFVANASEGDKTGAVASVDGEITHEYSIINGVSALVPPGKINDLKKNSLVVSVDNDVEVTATDSAADAQISADKVWPLGYTGSGVRLAILDTGIATTHPEFAGRIVACHTEVRHTSTCEDDNGHGTHVAGIAGAQGVNPSAKGVAFSVFFMSDKVLDSGGSGSLSGVIAGIDWAVLNNAKIVSMSLGTSPVDGGGTQPNCDSVFPTLTSAVGNAVARGVTVVAAAGNSGAGGLGAPGCISSVIAAGAVDSTDIVASFSSVGAAMNDHGIAAPGVDIFSTWLNGGYATLSGTSMATPMVSGTVALLLSKNPTLSPGVVRNLLFSNADCVTVPSLSCPNSVVGAGRVNALRAVNAAPTTGTFDFSVSANPASGSVVQGGSSSATVTVSLVSGTTQSVALTATQPGSGITVSVNPSSGSPTFTSTLSVATSDTTPTGTYTVTVTGTSGSLTHAVTFTLTVTNPPPPDFGLAASPSAITITLGGSGTSTITISRLSGFTGSVSLSATSPPAAGVTATFNPNPAAGTSSLLTLAVAASATPGTYSITITGTSGSLTHSVTITLTIGGEEQGQH